jgi:regulatory protein
MAENLLYKTALSKAMALCSRKECCCNDIHSKLMSWGIGTNDSEKIISTLLKEKFIDERRYASAYARDKFIYNKWGKIKIGSNLKLKKIPSDIIKQSLESIDYESYRKMIVNLLTLHRKKVKAKNQYDMKAKLMRFGLSKGFESSLLYEILGEEEV